MAPRRSRAKSAYGTPVRSSNRQRQLPHPLEEVEAAVKSFKKGKSAGADNVTAELVQAGGETQISALLTICNKIWQRGEWPTPWTQSHIIILPKKGNLQLCQNYRTINLIIKPPERSYAENLAEPTEAQAEKIIAEEQAGFRPGRSTTGQISNLRRLCEKYLQHQQDLCHVFVDFKKAFDRVWHATLWATTRQYNINANLIRMIQNLYGKATSTILLNNSKGDWFRTTVGVRQGCVLSPNLFNIVLERIMTDALNDSQHWWQKKYKLAFCRRHRRPGRNGEEELADLVERLDKMSTAFDIPINAEKSKLMTINTNGISTDIRVNGEKLDCVNRFKYQGAIIADEGSKPEIFSPGSPRPQQHSQNSRPSGMTGI
ncbi:hypothetical protein NP493_554g00025 [Ridgeia piscesae]|uniref:Reverse transcriptase domain-containing protein n=1 Tax=Ridgeia piscesae TaxID=27915 RepID=A0AAD9KV34_RIDPI|nr:hypothetical protein NP493_554g00025 [Ridgeia piscesae]